RRGEVVDRLILDGPQPTNCAFALEGRKLRVTVVGKGQVEEMDIACDGLPLHLPKFA
ncbi:sugar lactone lactonase YvrE, partial [Bradyrhizobium sp. CIR3A]|nr:sugar lactone lactonase YvrE [Bradyrhizobium sp. CIR3A]